MTTRIRRVVEAATSPLYEVFAAACMNGKPVPAHEHARARQAGAAPATVDGMTMHGCGWPRDTRGESRATGLDPLSAVRTWEGVLRVDPRDPPSMSPETDPRQVRPLRFARRPLRHQKRLRGRWRGSLALKSIFTAPCAALSAAAAAFFLTPALLAAAPQTVLAPVLPPSSQPASDAAPAAQLDPVVVTAARAPQKLSDTLAPTQVITREQIEQAQAGDIASLLARVAGLEVARNGGPGATASVFTRGGNSNHTLVLLDGVKLNPATAGGAALANISPEMIERIEIVQGPRSSLYGSDAIAGVINIVTRRPQTQRLDAAISAGSYGTVDGSLGYADRIGRYGFAIDTQQQHSDGFPSCATADGDRGYTNSTVNLRADAAFDEFSLEARVWNTQGKSEYFDSCSPLYGLHPLTQDFRNQTLALAANWQITPIWHSAWTASRGEDRVRQYQADPVDATLGSDSVRTVRPALDWQNDWRLGRYDQLALGADYAQERVDSLSYGRFINDHSDIVSGFLQNRYDYGRYHLLAAGSFAHYSDFGDQPTWNLEYGLDLLRGTRFSAAAGTGFHAPNADDRYGFGGNPQLRPERARNYDVGLRQQLSAVQYAELHVFRNDVSDLIVVQFSPANDPDQDFGYKAVNVARARSEGVQLQWQYDDGAWAAQTSGVIQNPRDRDSGAALLRRARGSADASLRRRFGRYFVDGDVHYSGGRPDIDAVSGASVRDGGYVVFAAAAGVHFAPGWQLALRLDNLLDHDYQTAAGYRQTGRAAYVALRYGGAAF